MRRLLLIPTLLAAACGASHDRHADNPASAGAGGRAATSPASVAPVPPDTTAGAEEPGPRTTLTVRDPWLPVADSAIRRHLEGSLFQEKRSGEFGECSDDDGSENPTIGAAAASARPIRRTHAELEPFAYGHPMHRATYDVEVRSVAIIVPQWIAKFPTDSTMQNTDPYQAVIGARTDTFSVSIGQPADGTGGAAWDACDPTGPAVSEGDGPGFWFFAHASDQPNPEMRIVRWIPATGSWARIVAMADSARKERSGIRN